jgi:alpha,alpha-trehalose phosphorylase
VAVAVEHAIEGATPVIDNCVTPDCVTHTFTLAARVGVPVQVDKWVTYDTAADPVADLVDNCVSNVVQAAKAGAERLLAAQHDWLADFWARADITIAGPDTTTVQQGIRWSLFQLAQATAQSAGHGIGAKAVTGSGYCGHYFWDTETFVLPFLTYTDPATARTLLEFRHAMLPAARRRATVLGHVGALFPWRTINGEEASPYFPAGTAQYHIDADIAYAVSQYVAATCDDEFLAGSGVDLLVETARLWADLGFYGSDGTFHLHEVTGPDEYSALVDDNLYTNAMARSNLRAAADAVDRLKRTPEVYQSMVNRLGLSSDEPAVWRRAAAAMTIPFDAERGVHAQDAHFLERQVWDFAGTPADQYPLLLHFHPLVIYRHQVLKQADLILALWLLSSEFNLTEKVADVAYYDPLTTGDSTLSAPAQQILAAEVGATDLAWDYFLEGLAVDLADSHSNTVDGVHIASAGGLWAMLVAGFGGFRDDGGHFRLDPRLPAAWDSLTFRLTVAGWRLRVVVERDRVEVAAEVTPLEPKDLTLIVAGQPVTLAAAH